MTSGAIRGFARAAFTLLLIARAPGGVAPASAEEGAPAAPGGVAGEPANAALGASANAGAPVSPAAASTASEGVPPSAPATAPAGAPATVPPSAPTTGFSGADANPRPGVLESLGVDPVVPAPTGGAAASPSQAATPPSRAVPRSPPVPAGGGAPLAWPGVAPRVETAQALRIVLGLTVLAIVPALLVSLTSFLRIIIVLAMLRHAIGMNETPPNTALTGLALFLTLFTMAPVLQKANQDAFQPFMANQVSIEAGYERGMAPFREYMVRQTREQDLALMVELSKASRPRVMGEISNVQLIPAYMLSELRAAFQIGFVVFLPFLLIDIVVSSILMSLGMMMMPPTTVSLPLKVLMFVLIDGWSLLLKALVGSFH